jgi:GrpB-like predicted nucleotidyltransferase (UPF0157 family)
MPDDIRIVDYDPAWPQRAAVEIGRIAPALGPLALRVEHIGSTSVPGLAAKPILDFLVVVDALDRAYVEPLERLGYQFTPFADSPHRHFFGRPPERPRTHHVHVVAAGTHEERTHLAFRDHLRTHPEAAREYAAAKRVAATAHPTDIFAYTDAKAAIVERIEAEALAC